VLTRTEALLASADYRPVLKRLEKTVEDERGSPLRPVDRVVLEQTIVRVIAVYDGTRFLADLASFITLHELREPLARVLEILRHEANYDDIFVALGAPAMLALSPDQPAVDRAVARYENLLDYIDAIARSVPPPPAKRPRGPQPAKDLRALVDRLAEYWERTTGHQFKQDWHRESSGGLPKPETAATEFVYEVVKFIDASRLGALPKMTEDIVKERRKKRRAATSDI
jgi:hypothetical protein